MNATKPPGDKTADAVNLEAWAKDWITLWQSELTAMTADRELREGWTQLMALWAGAASHAVEAGMQMARNQAHHDRSTEFSPGYGPGYGPGNGPGNGRTYGRPDDAARAAPGAAAPDAGRDEVDRLHRRIADLEARLLAVERGAGPV